MSSEFNNESTLNLRDVRVWRNVLRFLTLLWAARPGLAAGLAACIVAAGVFPVVQVALIGRLVGQLAAGEAVGTLLSTAGLWVATMIARRWAGLLAQGIEDSLRDQVGARLNKELLRKAHALELAFFEDETSYDRLQRANAGLGFRLVNIYWSLLDTCRSLVSAAGYTTLLSGAHWALALVLMPAMAVSLWLKTSRAVQGYVFDYDTLTPARRRLSYFQGLVTGGAFAKEVRLFDLGPHFIRRYQEHQQEWKREILADTLREVRASLLTQGVIALAFGGAALLLAGFVGRGQLEIGDYVTLIGAVMQLQGVLESIMWRVRNVYQDGLFAQNLFSFLDRPIDPVSSGDKRLPDGPVGVRFEDVWFRYPNSTEWVLSDVSFEIAPGETISLVGRNGAGKSTLVKLLMGLYRPQKGRILIGGIPVEELDEADLRRHVSAIFQDAARFELTLRESIGFGLLERLDDTAAVEAAAAKSGVDAIAARLEKGYETLLSPHFGGVDLSGGEWQKVALARALMRDAPILILDEPTAALDPRAELDVFTRFRDLAKGKTALMISHRIGTARLAQRIIVLKDGRVHEVGSHDELVAKGGEYADLFAVQAQWYRDESA